MKDFLFRFAIGCFIGTTAAVLVLLGGIVAFSLR